MTFDAAAIRAYTSGILRARLEYYTHPFAWTTHGARCAAEGCRLGRETIERGKNSANHQEQRVSNANPGHPVL